MLISPTAAIPAPTIPESRGDVARAQLLGYTRLFNVLGGPTLSVPCDFTAGGLPIGLQVAGRPFDDETILRVAHAYEREAGWSAHRPAV